MPSTKAAGDFSTTNLAILKFETDYSGVFDRVTM